MVLEIRDDRQMRALTGLSQAQFAQLLPTFSEVYKPNAKPTTNKRCKAVSAKDN